MDQGQIIDIAHRYSEVVLNQLTAKKVFLYGSQISGQANETSDIDIAFIVDKIDGDYLEASAKLYKLRRNFDDRIEPILIEENEDQSGFLEEILKSGKLIYNAEVGFL